MIYQNLESLLYEGCVSVVNSGENNFGRGDKIVERFLIMFLIIFKTGNSVCIF